jgi:hypothetical protein
MAIIAQYDFRVLTFSIKLMLFDSTFPQLTVRSLNIIIWGSKKIFKTELVLSI